MVERSLQAYSNRWWMSFYFLASASMRYLVLTDRNVYLCRMRASRRTPIEVFVKQPLGVASLSLKGRWIHVGSEYAVWLPWLPLMKWRARKLVTHVNEQHVEAMA